MEQSININLIDIFPILCLTLSIVARIIVDKNFDRFYKIRIVADMTGATVAENILHSVGIYDVGIESIEGELKDRYNVRRKRLQLSESSYSRTSILAIAIAAHECGHVIQFNKCSFPFLIRTVMLPIVSFTTKLSCPLVFLGLVVDSSERLLNIGLMVFSIALLFQIVTLPIEFDASRRAIKLLTNMNILSEEEMKNTKKVLYSAAFTYIAAAAVVAYHIIRLYLRYKKKK